MEWLTSIRTAIDYMEKHLTDDISAQDVADQVFLSPFFLQKGFSLMTGCGIGDQRRKSRACNPHVEREKEQPIKNKVYKNPGKRAK